MHLEHLCCGCDLTMHLLDSPLLLALGLVVAHARPKAMEENLSGISPLLCSKGSIATERHARAQQAVGSVGYVALTLRRN